MQTVVVFGGEGFVGTAVCELLKKEFSVLTAGRSEQNNICANILDAADVKAACERADVVINLVGLSPVKKPKGPSYEQVHIEGTKNILKYAKKLIHMSALGADPKSKNEYLRTKGVAQGLAEKYHAVVFRPSIIYDDDNELIKLMRKLQWTMLFPKMPARVQPVYRLDVAILFLLAVKGEIQGTLDVAGPDKMTLYDMAKLVYKGPCVGIPYPLVRLGARMFARSQLHNLELDNTTNSKKANKYVKFTRFQEWVKR